MSAINKKNGVRAGICLASSLVVLTSALAAQRAFAQDDVELVEEVVVEGTRASLQNAQDIKRESDTFVDAISASDIGSLPDRSVLEAMQRIPGVSIERFAASNDPDHFGVEGSGAVVRGMTQTRSEFNGRDSFTANSGRGLSFQDVPPELMQTVKLYKNQTADMIEGGIAGTVNLVTRKPFDTDGMQVALSADMTYGDMVKEHTPTFSGLFSNRWDTGLGEFGLLLNGSDSHLKASSHGIQSDKFELRGLDEITGVGTASGTVPGINVSNPYIYDGSFGRGVSDRQPRPNPDGSDLFCVSPGADDTCTNEGVLIPHGSNITMKNDDRYRSGLAAAVQWESPDDTLQVTVQYLKSDAKLEWVEHSLKNQSDYPPSTQYYQPSDQAPYGFDSDGVFSHGVLTNIAEGWRGNGEQIPQNADWSSGSVEQYGIRFVTDTRHQTEQNTVEDTSFNIKWTPTEAIELSADFQYVDAVTKTDSNTLMYTIFMNQEYDLRGGTPSLTISSPWALATDEEMASRSANGFGDFTNENYFSQLSSYVNHAAMDHTQRSNGDSTSGRIDGTYFIEDSFITSVQAGLRRAEREQTVRSSTYNWGALEPPWQTGGGGWLDQYPEYVLGKTSIPRSDKVDWSDFYRGGVANFDSQDQYTIHPSMDLMRSYDHWEEIFWDDIGDNCGDWRPLAGRIDEEAFDEDGNCLNRPLHDLNGSFRDNEITRSKEINTAYYLRADFEFDTAVRIAGNLGVRVVTIESESLGYTVFPDLRPGRAAPSDFNSDTFNPFDQDLYPNPADDLPYDLYDDSSAFLGDVNNFLPQTWKDFGNGVSSQDLAKQRYTETLPSLNIKAEFTPELLGRFAVSKAVALPDIGDMRNYARLSASELNYSSLDPVFTADNPHPDAPDGSGTGNPQDDLGIDKPQQSIIDKDSISLGAWRSEGGNPFLKPMESTQFDISLEWYFADAGSLTGALFYKDLNNFFITGAIDRQYTNPATGAGEIATLTSKMNGGEGEMQGFEVNYQQFFDMLPGPLSGLGTQINYSYIDAKGVPNTDAGTDGIDAETNSEEIGLEGQSDHTANLILMYQKYGLDARIAYNWRSEYLLTSYDVISRMPVYVDDAGYLDASIFYNITDNFKIGLQGVNLSNTQTKTYQLVDDELKLGRSWFINDRRYSLVVRANF
ncbi:TonB-dependent receptor [Alteromonadaceae bacterium Bs31]|nr:TonB-dependent receptor [Alteromonadaceae bacterium Bs31]